MYAAVIVETRKVPGFGKIVRNHLQFLPADWKLEVYCSAENKTFVEQELLGLDYHIADNTVVIKNTNDYNKLLMGLPFWEPLLKYERVLVFQTDSELLRPGIEEFLKWDYVGAPWPFDMRGGNGGLSIRNPKAMYDCIATNINRTPDLKLLLLLARMMFRRILMKGKHKAN